MINVALLMYTGLRLALSECKQWRSCGRARMHDPVLWLECTVRSGVSIFRH